MTTARQPRTPLVAHGQSDLHVRDMTATFAADVTLSAAQEQLAQHDQWLPIDGDPQARLGDLVANNSTGPLRLGYGAWRDLLLGVQFYTHNSQLITAGGRTVKNVAGYDLTKLMVGQHGRLSEIATLTARTYRRPAGAVVASFEPTLSLVGDLLPTALRPQWMLLNESALTCGYLGDEAALAFCSRKLADVVPRSVDQRSLTDDIADRAGRWTGAIRVSVPPANVAKPAGATRWIADPAFGIIRCEGDVEQIRQSAKELGGSVVDPPEANENDELFRRLLAAFE